MGIGSYLLCVVNQISRLYKSFQWNMELVPCVFGNWKFDLWLIDKILLGPVYKFQLPKQRSSNTWESESQLWKLINDPLIRLEYAY